MHYREQICEVLAQLPPDFTGAEIGVWRGNTSEVVLRRFPQCTWYMVDKWEAPGEDDPFYQSGDSISRQPQSLMDAANQEAVTRTAFAGTRRTIFHADSARAASILPDVDAVFIDACHAYDSVLADSKAWYAKARRVILWHDYGNDNNETTAHVKRAVDDFAKAYCLTINVGDGFVAWAWT